MRHAEKSGDPLDPHLTDGGQERARRLASYIPDVFGPPDCIFATAMSNHSNRPFETVEPLAAKLGMEVDNTFADQDYGALAQSLFSAPRYAGQHILICWHHGNIPSLARSLFAKPGDYPNPWDPLVFNLILQLDYLGGESPTVSSITEDF
jgi:hypothetical protein